MRNIFWLLVVALFFASCKRTNTDLVLDFYKAMNKQDSVLLTKLVEEGFEVSLPQKQVTNAKQIISMFPINALFQFSIQIDSVRSQGDSILVYESRSDFIMREVPLEEQKYTATFWFNDGKIQKMKVFPDSSSYECIRNYQMVAGLFQDYVSLTYPQEVNNPNLTTHQLELYLKEFLAKEF